MRSLLAIAMLASAVSSCTARIRAVPNRATSSDPLPAHQERLQREVNELHARHEQRPNQIAAGLLYFRDTRLEDTCFYRAANGYDVHLIDCEKVPKELLYETTIPLPER